MSRSGSKLIILFTLIISTVSAWFSLGLTFDYNFENFFPVDDPELVEFRNYREKFEPDNDFLLLGIENEKGIFDKVFLGDVDRLTDSIKNLPFIIAVVSPTNLKYPVIGGFGAMEIPYLHYSQPELYSQDSIKIYQTEELKGAFFSKDAKSVSLFIRTIDEPSKVKSDSIVNRIEGLLDKFNFDAVHFSGKVKAQKVYIEKMQVELIVFMGASAALVMLILLLSFRTIWGVLIPFLVVILSVIWIFGFMKVTGKPVDLMITLLPTIMFVVGMSDVIHIYSKYIEEVRSGKEKKDALKITVKEVGWATFLTSLTTAIGFLTLMTASIKPVKEFGIYMAIGVGFAYILAFTFFPAMLYLIPIPKVSGNLKFQQNWTKGLSKCLLWIFRNMKSILLVSVLLTGISLLGISRLKVNNFLLDDLNASHPLKLDFLFFENNFSGVRPFEIKVELKDSSKSILDHEMLSELEKLECYLKANYGVGFLISPVSAVKSLNKAYHGGNRDYFFIPNDIDEYNFLRKKLEENKKRKQFKAILAQDELSCRITGKMHDLGSYKISGLNDSLQIFIENNLNAELLEVKLTGSSHLIDRNNTYLALNMLQGLLLAFVVIALIAGFMYRSGKMILIALIPNMLPLLMVAGIMGYFNMDLKISTSIIFTIAFGIAVDDTIHFISKLKLELNKGKSLIYAIKRTFLSTGKAIILTSLVLCGGFLTLIVSDFSSTFYIGFLICLTLFFAMLADLILLPVLLILFYRKSTKSRVLSPESSY